MLAYVVKSGCFERGGLNQQGREKRNVGEHSGTDQNPAVIQDKFSPLLQAAETLILKETRQYCKAP